MNPSFIIFLIAALLQRVTSLNLLNACNSDHLQYDPNGPLYIENQQTISNTKNCRLTINGTGTSNFFMIRINLNQNHNKSKNFIGIIDHDVNHEKNTTLLNQTNVFDQFKSVNFIQIESKCFEIILDDGGLATSDIFLKAVKSITITAISHTAQNSCKNNEFKCNPSNICINESFRCDNKESCSDGSDELNCNVTIGNGTLILSNVTANAVDNKTGGGFKYFIGLGIILIVFLSAIVGAWIYGRRKRKWREFLAQLDNNTDWEYEQLDDNNHIMGSTTYSTNPPRFNMSISNEVKNDQNKSERLPIT